MISVMLCIKICLYACIVLMVLFMLLMIDTTGQLLMMVFRLNRVLIWSFALSWDVAALGIDLRSYVGGFGFMNLGCFYFKVGWHIAKVRKADPARLDTFYDISLDLFDLWFSRAFNFKLMGCSDFHFILIVFFLFLLFPISYLFLLLGILRLFSFSASWAGNKLYVNVVSVFDWSSCWFDAFLSILESRNSLHLIEFALLVLLRLAHLLKLLLKWLNILGLSKSRSLINCNFLGLKDDTIGLWLILIAN